VDRVAPAGGIVYHDVTERRWALKGLESGVHGLIAVNSRAGGHAGPRTAEALVDELGDLGVPLVCAGGIGTPAEFVAALRLVEDRFGAAIRPEEVGAVRFDTPRQMLVQIHERLGPPVHGTPTDL
jgi:NAD(P)H-dependent flavin oxidoreductase YrpB (nitropropane dioxygenase family)